MQLSAYRRSEILSKAEGSRYQLIVIGGGITGAGIALDAVSRGIKVLLLEKVDFAFGTSSRSTKLIHGGLRYLKQLEFGIVRETGHERAILHKNAPHIVKSENMLLPIYSDGSLGKYSSSIGLWLYDRLAGVTDKERRAMLTRKETLDREPLLRPDGLEGGGLYREYRSDDARLVIEVLKTAAAKGADILNYARVTDFVYKDEKLNGLKFMDELGNAEFHVNADQIINATGPWTDELRKTDKSLKGKHLQLTKGVHIVFDHKRLPLNNSVYFDVPGDKRMIFAIPRAGITYVGTTDTIYNAEIDNPETSLADVTYLINAVNTVFPDVNLKTEDILSSWAGLRPLIHEEGKSPSELSRKDEIFHSPSGLVSIAGGKLTGFRKMAERVVDIVAERLESDSGLNFSKCSTESIRLSGGDFKDEDDIRRYIDQMKGAARELDIAPGRILYLVNTYGSNTGTILDLAFDHFRQHRSGPKALLHAEIKYLVENEMVMRLDDFLIRRSGKLYFERNKLNGFYRDAARVLAGILDKPTSWAEEEIKVFEESYKGVVNFK